MGRCSATRADGRRCEGIAAAGREVCALHDPVHAERLAEGRQRGGVERSRPRATLSAESAAVEVRDARDVCVLLSGTINQVRTGQLDPRVANTVGYLASVLVRALEVGKLEERLEAVEAALRGGGPRIQGLIDRDVFAA